MFDSIRDLSVDSIHDHVLILKAGGGAGFFVLERFKKSLKIVN